MLKKILESKLLRFVFSVTLIVLAFWNVDLAKLFSDIVTVPVWFVVVMVIYFGLTLVIGAWRWSLLVLPDPSLHDVWSFTRSAFLGSFYTLVFPSMVAGDLLKWLPLMERYPHLSKTKLAGSVLIDRVVGFTAFILVALIALLVGKLNNYQFPDILVWLFSGLGLGVTVFYILVMTLDFEKWFGKYRILNKILQIVDLLKKENKNRIILCLLISMLAEPIWMLPVWFYSLMFSAGITLLQVYIFLPIISLILVLPISIAGFGARENLFLYFFSQLGYADEKILVVSAFAGIISVLGSLAGGLLLLIPHSKKEQKVPEKI